MNQVKIYSVAIDRHYDMRDPLDPSLKGAIHMEVNGFPLCIRGEAKATEDEAVVALFAVVVEHMDERFLQIARLSRGEAHFNLKARNGRFVRHYKGENI